MLNLIAFLFFYFLSLLIVRIHCEPRKTCVMLTKIKLHPTIRNMWYNTCCRTRRRKLEPKKIEVTHFVRLVPQTEHTCPICQKVFYASRIRVYCSLGCKQKASWERNCAEFNKRRRIKSGLTGTETVKGDNDEQTS